MVDHVIVDGWMSWSWIDDFSDGYYESSQRDTMEIGRNRVLGCCAAIKGIDSDGGYLQEALITDNDWFHSCIVMIKPLVTNGSNRHC